MGRDGAYAVLDDERDVVVDDNDNSGDEEED